MVGGFFGLTHLNTTADQLARFRIAGNILGINYRIGTNLGIFKIFIDGTFRGDIDSYSPASSKDSIAWLENLGDGIHDIVIRTTNSKNASSTANDFFITSFLVDARRNPSWIPLLNAISRGIGDSGRNPTNTTGNTLTDLIHRLRARLNSTIVATDPAVLLTTTALGASAVYTETGYNVSDKFYTTIRATAIADQASAANGFKIQESPDNTNWDNTIAQAALVANTVNVLNGIISTLYTRIQLTNGATAQTSLRISKRYNTA